MLGEFVEKRRYKKDSAAVRALRKIMPPLADNNMTLVDVIAAEAKDLRDAQILASSLYRTGSGISLELSDHAPRQLYRDRMFLMKPQVHAGQLKLFLSELRFLTKYASDPNVNSLLIYAGAAPGIHLPYLASLFPNVTFFLYDPREFCNSVFDVENITVISRTGSHGVPFNQRIANMFAYSVHALIWKQASTNLLFISDIRSGDVDDQLCDFEKCCRDDMDMQLKWLQTLKPNASMVKFRLPYAPGITKYPVSADGDLWLGVFAPRGSTELRLVSEWTESGCEMRQYDNTAIEEQAYYFNNFTRVAQYGPPSWNHGINAKRIALGVDNCWDCCAMREICYQHLSRKHEFNDRAARSEFITDIIILTGISLPRVITIITNFIDWKNEFDTDDSMLPEFITNTIILTGVLLPEIIEIIVNYMILVTENELYNFMTVVINECGASDKLRMGPHGNNPSCKPWMDTIGPLGFMLEPYGSGGNRIKDEVRQLYLNEISKSAGKK